MHMSCAILPKHLLWPWFLALEYQPHCICSGWHSGIFFGRNGMDKQMCDSTLCSISLHDPGVWWSRAVPSLFCFVLCVVLCFRLFVCLCPAEDATPHLSLRIMKGKLVTYSCAAWWVQQCIAWYLNLLLKRPKHFVSLHPQLKLSRAPPQMSLAQACKHGFDSAARFSFGSYYHEVHSLYLCVSLLLLYMCVFWRLFI